MRRFIAGRVSLFIPLLLMSLVQSSILDGPLFFAVLVTSLVGTAIVGLVAKKAARIHYDMISEWGPRAADDLLQDASRSDLAPIVVAVLVMACFIAVSNKNWMWIPVTLAIGVLLLTGPLLRWLIYDRWLSFQIRTTDRKASS